MSFNTVVTENVAAAAGEDADADAEQVPPESAMEVVSIGADDGA